MYTIYIACPFTTEDPEVFQIYQHTARYFGMLVAKIGAVPLMPTVNTGYGFQSTKHYSWWLKATQELLYRCDAIFITPGSINILESKGCEAERSLANVNGIPCFTDINELRQWILHNPQQHVKNQHGAIDTPS